ncbi:MAG: histidine kinase dimerization/phosphoacceptor domain -containing protein [Chitinophagales bacterium]
MKLTLSFFIMILTVSNVLAQSYEDSLLHILKIDKNKANVKEATFLLGEYLVQRNPEQAEIYADQLNSMSNTPKDSAEWGRLNYIYGASHRWQGNVTTALDYYQKNYDYYNRANDSINIAISAEFIGNINMFLGNNLIAQEYLLKCADIYAAIGTPKQRAGISKLLASFYLNIDQTDKAEEKYLDALQAFTIINDSAGMSSCNANLGLLYADLGAFEKAEEHLMRQKALNAVFPTQREMGFHYDFLGVLRKRQGRLQEAYEESYKALKIREGLSSTYNLCESKLSVGGILIELGRYEEAIDQLNDVLEFEEHNSFNQQNRAHELLSEAYEKEKKYKEALEHYKAYKAGSDSIYNEESIQIIAEKDAAYKKKEQDAEISLLNLKNQVTQQKLNKSKALITFSLIGLAIFSLLSFFIFLMYQKIKGKNVIIKKALSDKELLIQEIHHRVKNNLQIISSLLKLQSRYITDEKALEAIQDGRNRVQSMAILHKDLYKEDNVRGVNMKTYFSNLTQGIFNSYNLKNDKVALNLDIENVSLDVDTVIPIGLITNELISNSLKYAFTEGYDQAKIEVKLKEIDDHYELTVSDNGIGINDKILAQTTSNTFGQKMIKAFADKLKATVHISNSNGTEVVINIPKPTTVG